MKTTDLKYGDVLIAPGGQEVMVICGDYKKLGRDICYVTDIKSLGYKPTLEEFIDATKDETSSEKSKRTWLHSMAIWGWELKQYCRKPVTISGTWNRNTQTLTWDDPQGKDRTAWGEFNSEQEGKNWFIIHEEKDEEGQLLYTVKAAI